MNSDSEVLSSNALREHEPDKRLLLTMLKEDVELEGKTFIVPE